jgi:uncharacterized protein YndB with AHSA1/START domain
MPRTTSTPAQTSDAVIIERVFDAPRSLVWKAWSEPEHFKRWWGPRDYTAPEARIDFRVGGAWLACMRSADGQDIWATGVYREIVEPERIVTTDAFADAQGNVVPASDYGMEGDFPLEMLITVTLEDLGEKTRLTLRHSGLPVGEHLEGATLGWNESFDKLQESLHS